MGGLSERNEAPDRPVSVFLSADSRRASRALTENELHVRYSGSCVDERAAISESFTSTISRILHDEHGPCPPDHRCSVENVQVERRQTKFLLRVRNFRKFRREFFFNLKDRFRKVFIEMLTLRYIKFAVRNKQGHCLSFIVLKWEI